MYNLIKKIRRKLLNIFKNPYFSFSQSGEDLIIKYIFDNIIKLPFPTYFDIGAYHPVYFSNTCLFYNQGCRGVCIEPDPNLFREIKKKRKNDICLNVGIGNSKSDVVNFYIMKERVLNTFSEEVAKDAEKAGINIEEIVKIPLVNINELIEQYFDPFPNFISIDVEGLELDVIRSIDFSRFRPEIFCIETVPRNLSISSDNVSEIINFMLLKDYVLYADTYINTIFVDKYLWNEAKPIFNMKNKMDIK